VILELNDDEVAIIGLLTSLAAEGRVYLDTGEEDYEQVTERGEHICAAIEARLSEQPTA
jgi:hypothetical protein